MKITESNLNRTVTRAQAKAEREHNKGEQRVCGGCRHYCDRDGCIWAASHTIPLWMAAWLPNDHAEGAAVDYVADTDATDCEAYEHV